MIRFFWLGPQSLEVRMFDKVLALAGILSVPFFKVPTPPAYISSIIFVLSELSHFIFYRKMYKIILIVIHLAKTIPEKC